MNPDQQYKVISLSAPSGSGKTTIINYLLNIFPILSFSISATTRPARNNEIHGKDYYFISREEFENDIQQHKFLEWESVYQGVYYGTYLSEINRIQEQGKIPILDLDVVGGLNTKKKFGNACCSIFIYVPNIDDLRKRLIDRGMPDNEKLQERINKAEKENAQKEKFDFCITNIQIEKACMDAKQIVELFLNT